MKKIISLVLSFSMVLTILTVIPIIHSSASDTPQILTEINFDAEAKGNYNKIIAENSERQNAGMKPFVKLENDEHDNVYALYTIVGGHESGHRGYLLRNSKSEDNAALKLSADKSYKITLDYKNVTTHLRWYNIGIIWISNPDGLTSETLKSQFLAGKYNVFETHKDESKELFWEKASGIISPPDNENTYPVLVIYNYGWQNSGTEKVYLDNIVVSDYKFKTSNHIDFDYEAENGYDYYYNETRVPQVPATITNLEDGVHNNVFSIGLTGNTIQQRTYAIREEGSDTPLPLEFGKEYTIELYYKNKRSQADYNISIAWVENPSIIPMTGLPQTYYYQWPKYLQNESVPESYNPIKECPYVQDIATNISGGLSERGWVKIKSTITPYSGKKIYPVLLVRSADSGLLEYQAIYFDDITITLNTGNDITYIDFDAEAAGKYSDEYFIKDRNTDKKQFKKVDGNNVFAVYTSCGGDYGAMKGYALRNSHSADNEALKLTYGKNYKIKLDYKNVNTIYRYHCISLIWVDNPKGFDGNKLKDQFLAGKYTALETFAQSSKELDWKTVSRVITPPDNANVYPVLALYNYGYTAGGKIEVLFDNISVTDYEYKTSNYTDFTFETEENDYRYYFHETRNDRPATLQTYYNDTHKNVYHVGVTVTSGTHRAYAIREQGTADPLALQFGSAYRVKLNYKNIFTNSDYDVSVAWVEDPSLTIISGVPGEYRPDGKPLTNANVPPSYNPIYTSENAGKYVQSISGVIQQSKSEGDWTEISAEITPPDNKRIYPVVLVRPVSGGPYTSESIYLDDISVQLLDTTATDKTKIDFDLEYEGKYTYYQGGDNNSEYPAFKKVDGNSVYAVYTTKKYDKNLQKGYLLRNSTSMLNAPLKLDYSKNYIISMDYRNIKANGTYYVAIDWLDDPADINENYKPGNYKTLAMIAPTDDNRDNWRKIEQLITPPNAKDLYPVLFVYSNQLQENNLEICFDNISVSPTSSTQLPTVYDEDIKIDFDTGSQPEFFSDKNNTFTYRLYSEEGEYWTKKDKDYGKSAVFDRYASSTSSDSVPVVCSSLRTIGLCNTEGTKFANLKPGAVVDISFDINVVKSIENDFYVGLAFAATTDETATSIGGYRQYGGLYNISQMGMLCDIANVDATVSNWRTFTGRIVVPEHSEIETAWLTMYRKCDFGSMYGRGQEIYIDNITAKVVGEAHSMKFVSNGGSNVKTVYFLAGDNAVIPSVSKKEGFEFSGWYYDGAFTEKYDYNSKMPDADLVLYAKWDAYPAGLKATTLRTSFEKSDYIGGNLPYTNISDESKINFGNVTDDVNSKNTTVYYNSDLAAKTGSGYLEFDNRLTYNNEASIKANAVALLNSDGSNYYIVKGNRYRIKYAVRTMGIDNQQNSATPSINLVVSGLTPATGLSMNNATVVERFNYDPIATSGDTISREATWVYHEAYFEAAETGRAYIIMYDNTYLYFSTVLIDDLEIVPASDEPISKVTYKSYDGKKIYGTSLGCYGAAISAEYLADVRSGYMFDGWRTEDGILFTFDEFPAGDITLKAFYKPLQAAGGLPTINWENPISTDFENSDLAKIFYLDKRNVSNTQAVGLSYVTGDSENAHSGSSYFRFKKIKGAYQFKVYAENTPDNYIWLDENSDYLVTYYIKVTDMPVAYSAKFSVGTFNSLDSAGGFTNGEAYNYMFDSKRDQWIKLQQRLTTGKGTKTLGIKIEGGPVTALIDDVTVRKLGTVTVRFNSNGGSTVDDIQLATLDYAVEPEYPTKEGYEFAGWYADPEFKTPFKFSESAIENDITLYAKWELPSDDGKTEIAAPEKDKKYKTVYETEYVDETVENDLSKTGLKNVPAVGKSDVPAKTAKGDADKNINSEKNDFPWLTVLIITLSLVLAAGILTAVIIKIRKNKKTGGTV